MISLKTNVIVKSLADGSKLTKLCVTNETDSSRCVLSLWLTLCSIIAMNGNHALRILMWNFTEYFYTFLLTCASFTISKSSVGFPTKSRLLISDNSDSSNESKIKWPTLMPPDRKESKSMSLNPQDSHVPLVLLCYIFS